MRIGLKVTKLQAELSSSGALLVEMAGRRMQVECGVCSNLLLAVLERADWLAWPQLEMLFRASATFPLRPSAKVTSRASRSHAPSQTRASSFSLFLSLSLSLSLYSPFSLLYDCRIVLLAGRNK